MDEAATKKKAEQVKAQREREKEPKDKGGTSPLKVLNKNLKDGQRRGKDNCKGSASGASSEAEEEAAGGSGASTQPPSAPEVILMEAKERN